MNCMVRHIGHRDRTGSDHSLLSYSTDGAVTIFDGRYPVSKQNNLIYANDHEMIKIPVFSLSMLFLEEDEVGRKLRHTPNCDGLGFRFRDLPVFGQTGCSNLRGVWGWPPPQLSNPIILVKIRTPTDKITWSTPTLFLTIRTLQPKHQNPGWMNV